MAKMGGTGSEKLAAAFRKYGQLRRLPAGGQIFLKNDEAGEIYYLVKGRVRAYLLYPDGVERTLCYVESGNLVGEELMAHPPRRIVCADAATEILLLAMNRSQLDRAAEKEGEILRELLSLFMQKIELLCNWIFFGQFSHNEARIACFLYDHSERRAAISYTQEQIAQVTGMSRVSVSQCLGRFADNGLIEKGYGKIRVLDRPALREYFHEQEF